MSKKELQAEVERLRRIIVDMTEQEMKRHKMELGWSKKRRSELDEARRMAILAVLDDVKPAEDDYPCWLILPDRLGHRPKEGERVVG